MKTQTRRHCALLLLVMILCLMINGCASPSKPETVSTEISSDLNKGQALKISRTMVEKGYDYRFSLSEQGVQIGTDLSFHSDATDNSYLDEMFNYGDLQVKWHDALVTVSAGPINLILDFPNHDLSYRRVYTADMLDNLYTQSPDGQYKIFCTTPEGLLDTVVLKPTGEIEFLGSGPLNGRVTFIDDYVCMFYSINIISFFDVKKMREADISLNFPFGPDDLFIVDILYEPTEELFFVAYSKSFMNNTVPFGGPVPEDYPTIVIDVFSGTGQKLSTLFTQTVHPKAYFRDFQQGVWPVMSATDGIVSAKSLVKGKTVTWFEVPYK